MTNSTAAPPPNETDRPGFEWLDDDTVHTTYDMLLYGLDDVDYNLPLSPGSQVRVGPRRFRVLREEPETATVVLATDGLDWRHWLRYQREHISRRIIARLFWNRLAMLLHGNPLRRVCNRLGHMPVMRLLWLLMVVVFGNGLAAMVLFTSDGSVTGIIFKVFIAIIAIILNGLFLVLFIGEIKLNEKG